MVGKQVLQRHARSSMGQASRSLRRIARTIVLTFAGLIAVLVAEADQESATAVPEYGQVVLVRSPSEIMTVQKLPNFVGVSGPTVGARELSMNLVIIPPGGYAEPHSHQGFESAVYVLEGRVETRWGDRLQHSVTTQPGDFLFIPPGVPHQPVNLSATEPARAIVVRNDPDEQEHVLLYDPTAANPAEQ